MNEDFVFPDVDDKAQKLPDLNSANRVHGKGSHFNFELSRWRKFHNRKGDQAVEGEKK